MSYCTSLNKKNSWYTCDCSSLCVLMHGFLHLYLPLSVSLTQEYSLFSIYFCIELFLSVLYDLYSPSLQDSILFNQIFPLKEITNFLFPNFVSTF